MKTRKSNLTIYECQLPIMITTRRISRSQLCCIIVTVNNFAKLKQEQLQWNTFLNKSAELFLKTCLRHISFEFCQIIPKSAGFYLFKVIYGNARTMREICSKSKYTLQNDVNDFVLEVSDVNIEQISHIVLGFSLPTLYTYMPVGLLSFL